MSGAARAGFGPWMRAAVAIVLAAGSAGCEKVARNMYDQPRYETLAPSPLWSDGQSERVPVNGVVARSSGALAAASSGRAAVRQAPSGNDPGDRLRRLQRGRERYDIYCAPCHSPTGDGDGMVVRRGFPAPASFFSPGMREASDLRLADAIASGAGAMAPFADRVDEEDRGAIVLYIRALQRSRSEGIADVPEPERSRLLGLAP